MALARHPTRGSATWGARLIWGLSLGLLTADLGLVTLGARADPTTSAGRAGLLDVGLLLSNASFASVGLLLARARPGHRIGILLQIVGFGGALTVLSSSYANYVLSGKGSLPGLDLVAWLATWVWWPLLAVVGFFLPALFPNGHLPSPRWRPLAFGVLAGTLAGVLGLAFLDGPLGPPFDRVNNPFGIAPARPILTLLFPVGGLAIAVMSLAALASMLVRFRRAEGVERAQLKWFVASTIPLAIGFGATNLTYSDPGLALVFAAAILLTVLATVAVPLAIAIAILRYRLYDIDRLLNRAAVYGSVTVALAVAVGVTNVVLQGILESVVGQRSDLVTGLLAAGAVFAFGPVSRRLRPIVDRFLPARAQLTLLFTDIVGSTERIVELGDQRWRSLLDRYRASVRQELVRFGGREVDTAGDSFFAIFDRPLDGVRCAWAIQAAVRQLGLESRTGLHVDEVELRGEQVSGLAVHAAARIMAAAGSGEVLISDAVREAVADEVRLADRGRYALKGLPDEWNLYALEVGEGLG